MRLPLILSIMALFIVSAPSHAEFVQTGSIYQSSDGLARVIPSNLGIFFFFPARHIPLQRFSQADLTNGDSAFLEYDSIHNVYSTLHVGAKKFSIRGSFALKFGGGQLMVNVDNFPNPYCSAVIGDSTAKPSIVAINGITPVLKYDGREAVALLRANQSLSNISDIEPYEITTNNSVNLKGEELKVDFIGLDIPPPNNPCLPTFNKNSNTIYINHNDLKRIKAINDPAVRKQKLTEALKDNNTSFKLITSLVILKIQTESIIAFDPETNTIKVIKLISPEPKICDIQAVDLGKVG